MPTYDFEVGTPVTLPDDMPIEEQQVKVREIAQQRLRQQIQAGHARTAARGEASLLPKILPPPTAEELAQMERPAPTSPRTPGDLYRTLTTGEGLKDTAATALENFPAIAATVIGGVGSAKVGSKVAERVGTATRPLVGRLAGGLTNLLGTVGSSMGAQAVGTAGAQVLREGQVTPERVMEGAEAGILPGTLATLLGTGAAKVGPKIAAPGRASLDPEAVEAMRTLGPAGARLTPAQMTDSRLLDIMENVGMGGIFGGKGIRSQREATQEIADNLVREFRLKFPERGNEAIGRLYKGALNTPTNQGVPLSDMLVDTRSFLTEAENTINPNSRHAQVRRIGKWVAGLDPERTTFEELRQLRSDLLEEGRKPVSDYASQEGRGAAKHLAGILHDTMEQAATQSGSNAYANWRTADNTFKKALFGDFVEETSKAALTKPLANKRGGQGIMSGMSLLHALNKADPEDLKHFDPADVARFRTLARAFATAEQKNAEGTGGMLIQLMQGSALSAAGLAVFGGGQGTPAAVGESALILGLPRVFSYIATSPRLSRWLTTGLGDIEKNRTRSRALGLLMGELAGKGIQQSEDNPSAPYTPPWEPHRQEQMR